MSTVNDPIASVIPADRLGYAAGLLLDADAFAIEQGYHRARLARALTYLFGWGTVAGLAVRLKVPAAGDPNENEVDVSPGLAIDRIGRLVEVPRDQCVRMNRWFQQRTAAELNAGFFVVGGVGRVVVDVFLRFAPCPHRKSPALASGDLDATDAFANARILDGFGLDLVLRKDPNPPLPDDPWAAIPQGGAAPAEALRDAVYASWRDDRDDQGELEPLAEHDGVADRTSIFLARLILFATSGADASKPPVLDPLKPVEVRDEGRRFVTPVGALARWSSRPANAP